MNLGVRPGLQPATRVLVIAGLGLGLAAAFAHPPTASAENCQAEMPPRVSDASGYMFIGTLTAKRAESQRPPSWEFLVDEAFHGLGNINVDLLHQTMEPGTTMTFYDRCFPPQHLEVGERYLVSDASPATFSSMSTVVWNLLPDSGVRLIRQYRSRNMDPQLAVPRTVAEAVELMAPKGSLPPTDVPGADVQPAAGQPLQEWLAIAAGLSAGALVLFRRSSGSHRVR